TVVPEHETGPRRTLYQILGRQLIEPAGATPEEVDEGIAMFARGGDLACQAGDAAMEHWFRGHLALAYHQRKETGAALAAVDRAVELSGQLDDPASVALWRMNRAVILLHRPGDRETRLRALADAQAALAYRTPERGLTNHLYARINLGLAYQRTIPDDPANLDRAMACYETALGLLGDDGDPALIAQTHHDLAA